MRGTGDEFQQLTEFERMNSSMPRGIGMLHITDMELGNLGKGRQAWIESMSFAVTLALPGESGG